MYSPIIPIEINCIPPINMELIISDVQPVIVLSRIKCEIIAYKIIKKDINDMNNPAFETNCNGLSEKPVIPSNAKNVFNTTSCF